MKPSEMFKSEFRSSSGPSREKEDEAVPADYSSSKLEEILLDVELIKIRFSSVPSLVNNL